MSDEEESVEMREDGSSLVDKRDRSDVGGRVVLVSVLVLVVVGVVEAGLDVSDPTKVAALFRVSDGLSIVSSGIGGSAVAVVVVLLLVVVVLLILVLLLLLLLLLLVAGITRESRSRC